VAAGSEFLCLNLRNPTQGEADRLGVEDHAGRAHADQGVAQERSSPDQPVGDLDHQPIGHEPGTLGSKLRGDRAFMPRITDREDDQRGRRRARNSSLAMHQNPLGIDQPSREIHDLANMLLGGLEIAGHGFDDVIEVQMVMPITVYPGRSWIAKPRLRNTQDSVRRDLSREAGQIAGAANPKLAGHKRRTSLLPRLFYDVLRHQW